MIKITEDDIIQSAISHFRQSGFPYEHFEEYEILQIFRDLQNSESKLVKAHQGLLTNFVKVIGMTGVKGEQFLANYFHPHIWESHAAGARSPVESYKRDDSLLRCMTLSLKYEKVITEKTVRNYLRKVNGTQMCSNFRPSAAKAVYDYFGADDVLDMSTGYGGRLLGFLASKSEGFYFGVDPSKETCKCNNKIAKYFKQDKRVHIVCCPFEESKDLPKVDLAFTSPPYFRKEVYVENDKSQSREKFPEYEIWLNEFLKVMVQKTRDALKNNGRMAINIADVRINSKSFPLINDTISIATKNGFLHEETLHIKFPGFGKNVKKWKTEPVLVFSKI
jgi:hypothetical protein